MERRRLIPTGRLEALVKEAMAKFDLLTPIEKEAHRRAQRRSWVIGEMMIENPELGRSYVEKILDKLGA